MDTITIAIIGANGVGKSAFIQRALRLSRLPNQGIVTFNWTEFDGSQHVVNVFEVDLEAFDMEMNGPIRWPKQANGLMAPPVDGALVLYDVMNKDSISPLGQTLSSLSVSNYPMVLVATKCDNPEDVRELDTASVAAAYPAVVANFSTSANTPNTTRECLQVILRAIVANRRGDKLDAASQRRRAASAANLELLIDVNINGRPESVHSKHSRASSDLSMLKGFQANPNDRDNLYRGSSARSPRAPTGFGTDEAMNPSVASQFRQSGARPDVGVGADPFYVVDESDVESFRTSTDDVPILQRSDESFVDRPPKTVGISFDELVDKLLAPRMTRADNNFADIFLCLYRKFAAPGQLFAAILARLERAKEDKSDHYLTKKATQMRIIEVVARWVSLYPGDFARPTTKKTLERFIVHLASEPAFIAAASQMRGQLETSVTEDDDTGWAQADDPPEDPSLASSPSQSQDLEASLQSLSVEDPVLAELRRPSQTSDLSHAPECNSSAEINYKYYTYEDYEREAAKMVPQANLPLNKFRYQIFMEINPDEVAEEITRIDWVMFSSVRIRDWVRHVSLKEAEKERCRSLKNANRLISHFNHVAKWVQNMILIRDKAKHRAPCLEKFMTIAYKLRKLNNYNGLGAVVAGLQNANIARLHATQALVSREVWKQYQSAETLMLSTKSNGAYRMAWENSRGPRIPYMALHRRDLTATEGMNKTFVGPNGDRVNWQKFEILGEILLPIMRSQAAPYPNLNKKHEYSRELILDCRMELDDDALYQRSKQVEPTGAAGGTTDLKKKTMGFLRGS